MKDLQLATEERSITKTGENMCKARELLRIMACSENSETFNAIFKNKSLTATALCLASSPQPRCLKMSPPLFIHFLTSHVLHPLQSGCCYHNQQISPRSLSNDTLKSFSWLYYSIWHHWYLSTLSIPSCIGVKSTLSGCCEKPLGKSSSWYLPCLPKFYLE